MSEAEKKYILPLLQLMLHTTLPKAHIETTKVHTENDWKEVTLVAHRMKGSVLYVATRLAYGSYCTRSVKRYKYQLVIYQYKNLTATRQPNFTYLNAKYTTQRIGNGLQTLPSNT